MMNTTSLLAQRVPPPSWIDNLIIYEINPYAFSSPNGAGDGSGSGTFKALKDKMEYLGDLGINGIWLAGFSSSTDHFYGIKTVYACINPEVLDPSLGNEKDFKDMIDEAHKKGIKIFLDVITHGVVAESPLVKNHPAWFEGKSWKMADFDYDNTEFINWWVNVWVKYVVDYGIDGFRLDGPNGVEASYKVIKVWDKIVVKCLKAGHLIVVWPETARYHFSQWDNKEKLTDIGEDYFCTDKYYCHQISCHDNGWESLQGNYYSIKGSRGKFIYALFGYNIPLFMSGEEFNADQISLPGLKQKLYGDGEKGGWLYGSWIQWEQLKDKEHSDMLIDVKKMIKIRRENSDLINNNRSTSNVINLTKLPNEGLVPYARFVPGEKAIVVITNPLRRKTLRILSVN